MAYQTPGEPAVRLAMSDGGLTFRPVGAGRVIYQPPKDSAAAEGCCLFVDPDQRYHAICPAGVTGGGLLHAASDDLRQWSDPEVLDVMADEPRLVRLVEPGCYCDRQRRLARIYWTAEFRSPSGTIRRRIWAATTANFSEISPAVELFDPGYDVCQAAVAWGQELYLMAFKDDRGRADSQTYFQAIRVGRSQLGTGPFVGVSARLSESGAAAAALGFLQDHWLLIYRLTGSDEMLGLTSPDGTNWSSAGTIQAPRAQRFQLIEIPDRAARSL
ncbi:MAG: hypothetical protein ACLFUJ_05135 [Phycisphaerae bacterium]